MNNIYKHVLVASLLMVGGTAMAQTLNSAYFTEDYKFRHDMNPAFENKQNYRVTSKSVWIRHRSSLV